MYVHAFVSKIVARSYCVPSPALRSQTGLGAGDGFGEGACVRAREHGCGSACA